MTIFRNFGLNHAEGVTEGVTEGGQVVGTACMAFNNTPPRYTADLSRL
jgi:hypothetical protein